VLGSTLSNDSCVLRVDLTNPDFRDGDLVVLSKNLLHIGRTLFISRETLHQRLTLHNYGAETIQLLLSLAFESDFADVFEVRGVVRGRRGTSRTEASAVGATLAYAGRDGVIRRTNISFDPKPLALTENCASYRIDLTPHSAASLYTTVTCDSSPEGTLFLRAMRRAHLERKRRMRVETKIHTSNHSFNEMLRRATSDLAMLLTETPQGYYPYAGIPWYSTTFGRDGLIAALQCLWLDRRIPIAVLKRLAATQPSVRCRSCGPRQNTARDARRRDSNSKCRSALLQRVDSTPLFVLLRTYRRRPGTWRLREWPAVEGALAGSMGLGPGSRRVEYHRQMTGAVNQVEGFRDSRHAIRLARGRSRGWESGLCLAKTAAWCAGGLASGARAKRRGRPTRLSGSELGAQRSILAGARWRQGTMPYALPMPAKFFSVVSRGRSERAESRRH
jgi:hypothetical protein